MDESHTRIGRIKSVNPARREVRIDAPKARVRDAESWSWLYIEESDGELSRYKIARAALKGECAVVELAPGVPRDTVRLLKGRRVLRPKAASEPKFSFDGEATDLVGMTIESNDGSLLGEIVAGFETKANGVLEVLRPDGSSLLLPLVPEVIEGIDLDKGKVIAGDIAPFAVEHGSGSRLV